MKVSKALMTELRKLARDYCGGYKHSLEVQTWDGKIDSGNMTEDEEDAADVDHFDLIEGVELPDNAEHIDVQVFGVEYKGDTEADAGKLGYFYISLNEGKITESWQ